MGMYAARKARTILENVKKVLAIELLTAAQGVDFRKPLKLGKGTSAAYEVIRARVPFMEEDEFLHPYIQEMVQLVDEGTIVIAVENAIGKLA
jgi:histidine ammonia-lyase